MKKKKSTYFLVFAVIIIWIIVLVRFTSIRGDKSDNRMKAKVENSPVIEKRIKEKLNLSYRDPFSRKVRKQENSNAESIKNSLYNKEVRWPAIVFNGYITNKKTRGISINLSIEGKSFIAREKQVIENITIKRITNSFIEVEYNGVRKEFYLSK